MAMRRAAPLVFPASGRHTASVIFIHGLGDSGHGWAPAVENWRRRQRLDEVKFILPHAPTIPITVNMGYPSPGWYDIAHLRGSIAAMQEGEDAPGIKLSQEYFHSLIQAEIDAGIPADRIVIGGFSQGGAMSLLSGLTASVKLAGIVGLSCYLLLSKTFADILPQPTPNLNTPVFMGHGNMDPVVAMPLGKMSYETLTGLGFNVSWNLYEGMGHSACLEELDEIEAFLKESLPALGDKAETGGKSEL